MKKLFKSITAMCLILVYIMSPAFSHNEPKETVDRLVVKFSDPSKPGLIEAALINGGITVTGYDGKEVIVEARTRSKKISRKSTDESTKGMKRIPITTTGLTVEEEHNKIEISVESWKRTIDLDIRSPFNTSLKLNCVNAGDITVKNLKGEIDVNNTNGKVTLVNISGAVVAHALNRKLMATFKKVDPKKPMSFSTLNGDIDVIFPANLRADVKLKSDNGDIYSDFDIRLEENPRRVIEENTRDKGGKYRIRIERIIYGSINGGGPEIQFTSFNGDIFIRKGK